MTDLATRIMAELVHAGGWHLVSDNPETGVRKFVNVEMVDAKFQVNVMTQQYAIDRLFDANARARADTAGRPWGDWARIASVPVPIWQQHLAEAHDVGDDKYVDRWLGDSDHAAFRTKEGNL